MLTGNDLLTKIDELRAEHPAITQTEIVRQCGYVKENGKANYVEFYTALIAAKGLDLPSDEDLENDENGDLYEELCDEYPQGAVDAFIELYDKDELNRFEDCFIGCYDSEAAFAEEYVIDVCGNSIPSYVVVDWDATWNCNLRYDFDFEDGFVFTKN